MHTQFWLGSLKGRDQSNDLGVGERLLATIKRILGKQGWRVSDGFLWARDRWQAVMNTVMNLHIP
jgi:hypothetical protein